MKLQRGDLAVLKRPDGDRFALLEGLYLNVTPAGDPPPWVPGSSSLGANVHVMWGTVITVLSVDEPGWDGVRWIEALWPDGRIVRLREEYWKKA